MQTKDDLIRENSELRARLELAEQWMQREVQIAMRHIQKKEVQSVTRKHFSNLLEEEGIDIIARRIHDTFGDGLANAPEYTLERLIDAEIYWQTLQKYPTMDGLPIILAYQKILDAWVEEKLIATWRKNRKWNTKGGMFMSPIERDIQNILTKDYTLSIGRLYQILKMVRDNEKLPLFVVELVNFWKKEIPEIFSMLVSDVFFLPFSELMEREIFTKKRHEKKVTFGDVKKTREIFLGSSKTRGLLQWILIFQKE